MKKTIKSALAETPQADAAFSALDRIAALLDECACGMENEAAKWEINELIFAVRQYAPMAGDLDRMLCNLEACALLLYSSRGHQRVAGGAHELKRKLLFYCALIREKLSVMPGNTAANHGPL